MKWLSPTHWLCVLVALGALYGAHRGIVAYEVADAVRINTIVMENEYKGQLLVAAAKARLVEDDLKLRALQALEAKDEKIKSITDQRDVAIERLRMRPSRPATPDNSPAASVAEACTGAKLYKEDGEFLIRLSGEADQVVVERDFYYQRYEDARKKLDEYSH